MIKFSAILFLFFLSSTEAHSQPIKLLNANIMCDFCGKDGYDSFDKRMEYLQQTVLKYTPDIISFQEFRTKFQIEYLLKQSPQYKIVLADFGPISYPDAAIVYNSLRMIKVDSGHLWLGPNGEFSFGWEFSLPRIMIWAKLKDKITKKEFIVISSHFDNRVENLLKSGHIIQDFIKASDLPVIVAADTNLPRDYEGYKNLVGDNLLNTYEEALEKKVNSNYEYSDRDKCYTKKGKVFPNCSVEHVLVDKKSNWKVISWQLDVFKFGPNMSFASDHRPVYVELSL